jgi:hypothetical protein
LRFNVLKAKLVLVLVCAAVVGIAAAANAAPAPIPTPMPVPTPKVLPTPLPAPTPIIITSPNPAVDIRAQEWFRRLQGNHIDYSQLDDEARMPLDYAVALIISTQWSVLGNPVSFDLLRAEQRGQPDETTAVSGETTYIYHLTFPSSADFNFLFSLDPNGKISGLQLTPGYY